MTVPPYCNLILMLLSSPGKIFPLSSPAFPLPFKNTDTRHGKTKSYSNSKHQVLVAGALPIHATLAPHITVPHCELYNV